MKLFIVLLALLFCTSAYPVTRYNRPAQILLYENGDGLGVHRVVNGLTTRLTPVNTTSVITVTIVNKLDARILSVAVKKPHDVIDIYGVHRVYEDSPDFTITGCGEMVARDASCTAEIIFKPQSPVTVLETLLLFTNNIEPGLAYSLIGYGTP